MEDRSGGQQGMTAVLNVIGNRSAATGDSPYAVCTAHAQYTSMSKPINWPTPANVADYEAWDIALTLVEAAANGGLPDITGGATLYYAIDLPASEHRLGKTFTLPSGEVIPFPDSWNEAVVTYKASVGGQVYFSE
jgi:hypothetical protein